MAVRFKFRSSVEFDSVDVDGPFISVCELRAKILEQNNLKICQDFDLIVTDAETGEVYDDENSLVPEGSSVIIKRVPAGISKAMVLPCIDSVENPLTKYSDPIDALGSSPSANADMDNFDDFGIDLYSAPETSYLESDPDVDKLNCMYNEKAKNALQKSSASTSGNQNLEASELSEAVLRGGKEKHCGVECGVEGEATDLKFEGKEHKKPNEVVDTSSPTLPNTDLPSELRCSLCKAIFKEAVMIPCCQHSFCDKCIRLVLVEKARCPKCSSTKCKVDDLLPNVSLRRAIEHFLESQVPISGSDNVPPKYAPDGESRIQAKEVSCAVSVFQREPLLPHSPSATGKGSNQVMAESACELLVRGHRVAAISGSHTHLEVGKHAKTVSSQHRKKQVRDEDEINADASLADLEDDSKPFELHQNPFQTEEASYANKKGTGNWLNAADGSGSLTATDKNKKGLSTCHLFSSLLMTLASMLPFVEEQTFSSACLKRKRQWDRNCYMCGSPFHLVKDCPAASSPYPMVQTGDPVFPGSLSAYGPPSYWPGASLTHVRPFTNLYGAPGLMPFDPTVVPVTPFTIPPYMPSMYAGLPVHYGFMRMGGLVPPMVAGAERPLSRVEFMELRESERRRRLLSEQQQREQTHDGNDLSGGHYYEPQRRSNDHKPEPDGDSIRNYSEDSENRRLRKKHTHDKRLVNIRHQMSGFVSDVEDMHSLDQKLDKASHFSVSRKDHRARHEKSYSELRDGSQSSGQHSRERTQHQRSSKKHKEKREQCGSDSCRRNHRKSRKEMPDNCKSVDLDAKKHSLRHHNHSETGVEPSLSGDRKRQRRDKGTTHSCRHSKHKVKNANDESDNDRWEMVDGLDAEDAYFSHRRKRNH